MTKTTNPTIAYVYKWTELSTLKWYIGSRTAKDCRPDDGYICSSKTVKPMIIANLDGWKREILETGSPIDMRELEAEILTCLGAAKSEYSYNKTNGSIKFSTIGIEPINKGKNTSIETRLKISKASLNRPPISEETRRKLSITGTGRKRSVESIEKTAASRRGTHHSLETRAKMSQSSKNMSAENKARKNKPRTPEQRAKMSAAQKGVPKPISTCPHCNKSGGSSNMKRWHFDNCKSKPL